MKTIRAFITTVGRGGAVAALLALLMPSLAQAIPAFARQVGQPCTACHYQHFPTLNSFGRAFKASGYSLVGTQGQIEGDGLAIPETLNAALVGSLQYVKGDAQEIGFPAALSLYLAGKVADNAGFMMEIPFENQMVEGETDGGAKVMGETEGAVAAFGSLKGSYFLDVQGIAVGLHAYSTEMAGPAYGYELLSTGAMGMNVAVTGNNAMGAIGLHMEHGATLMSQFMGDMSMPMAGAATGFGVSAQNSLGYVYVSQYIADQKVEHFASPKLGSYLRAVWTPTLAGLDVGVGTQIYLGETTTPEGRLDAKATTFDVQVQGQAAGRPFGLYASYATAPKSDANAKNWYNLSTGGDNSAIGILAEVGLMDRLSASVGFVSATYWMDMMMGSMVRPMDQKGTSTSLGLTWLWKPNLKASLDLVKFGGDLDATNTVATLQAGF